MIHLEAIWLAVEPLDMRAGLDRALARVVQVFGEVQPHQAYLFANRRATRMKVLVHDGFGVWLAARRLNRGGFVWPRERQTACVLNGEQFAALIIGLPWEQLAQRPVIHTL